jgi:hypothetical protein
MSIKRTRFGLLAAVITAGLLTPMASHAAGSGNLQFRDDDADIAGFAAADVLFDPTGFPIRGVARPNARYAAFGVAGSSVQVRTSANGTTWAAAQTATLHDPTQGDVPLVIGTQSRIAVAYVPANILPHNYQFVMTYAPQGGNPSGQTPDPLFGPDYQLLSNLRYALSANGVDWYDDNPVISDNSTEPVIKANTFKHGILGPTDLIYNTGGDCYSTVTLNTLDWGGASPFACEFTLVYTAVDSLGNTSVALAGGIFFVDIGIQLRGAVAPALTRAGAAWTSSAIDRAHVTRTGTSYVMGVSGSTTATSCTSAANACDAGTASSTNGNTFTADRPSAASITAAQAAALAGAGSASVQDLQMIADDGQRWYSSFAGNTWIAYEAVNVGTAPRLTFLAPKSGYVSATEPNITLVLNDDGTTGNGIGFDLGKLSITMDNVAIPGSWTLTSTAIGQVNAPGTLVSIPGFDLALPDGQHTLGVSAVDLDGETVSGSRSILIDRTAPSSVVTAERSSGFTFPFGSTWFEGSSQDVAVPTGLLRMRGVVTNPLGQQKVFEEGAGETNSIGAGFHFTNLGPRASNGGPSSWDFTWAVPSGDPLFWAIPGTYSFQMTAVDFAGNVEGASAANTRSFLLI